jgi:hypothetical protein
MTGAYVISAKDCITAGMDSQGFALPGERTNLLVAKTMGCHSMKYWTLHSVWLRLIGAAARSVKDYTSMESPRRAFVLHGGARQTANMVSAAARTLSST